MNSFHIYTAVLLSICAALAFVNHVYHKPLLSDYVRTIFLSVALGTAVGSMIAFWIKEFS